MSSRVLWEGMIEKKGSDFFGRWNKRRMAIVGDECRYYEADSVTLRGIIKLVDSSSVSVNSGIVTIRTIGRPEKQKEVNGRDFQLRISDCNSRVAFVALIQQIISNLIAIKSPSKSIEQSLTPGTPESTLEPLAVAQSKTPAKTKASLFGRSNTLAADHNTTPTKSNNWAITSLKNIYSGSNQHDGVSISSPPKPTQKHGPGFPTDSPPLPGGQRPAYTAKSPSSFIPPTPPSTTPPAVAAFIAAQAKAVKSSPKLEHADSMKVDHEIVGLSIPDLKRRATPISVQSHQFDECDEAFDMKELEPTQKREKSITRSFLKSNNSFISDIGSDVDHSNIGNDTMQSVVTTQYADNQRPSPRKLNSAGHTSFSNESNKVAIATENKYESSKINSGNGNTSFRQFPPKLSSDDTSIKPASASSTMPVRQFPPKPSSDDTSIKPASASSTMPVRQFPPKPSSDDTSIKPASASSTMPVRQFPANALQDGSTKKLIDIGIPTQAVAVAEIRKKMDEKGTGAAGLQPIILQPTTPSSAILESRRKFETQATVLADVETSNNANEVGKKLADNPFLNRQNTLRSSDRAQNNERPLPAKISIEMRSESSSSADLKKQQANKLVEEALKGPTRSLRPASNSGTEEKISPPLATSLNSANSIATRKLALESSSGGSSPSASPKPTAFQLADLNQFTSQRSEQSVPGRLAQQVLGKGQDQTRPITQLEDIDETAKSIPEATLESSAMDSITTTSAAIYNDASRNGRRDIRAVIEALANSTIGLEPELPVERTKLSHTKSERRPSNIGRDTSVSETKPITIATKLPDQRPVSMPNMNRAPALADRRRVLASPLMRETSGEAAGLPPSPGRRLRDEETLEARVKRIEIEELGPEIELPAINEKSVLLVVKRYVELSNALFEYWASKPMKLVNGIQDIQFPAELEKRQIGTKGEIITSFDELFKAARAARPFFSQAVKQAAFDVGITIINNCSSPDCLIYLPPIPAFGEVLEKANAYDNDDYANYTIPPEAWILDIVRGHVVCLSEQQILEFIEKLSDAPLVRIVKLQNRFVKPPPSGYRDILLTLQVEYQDPNSTKADLRTSKFYCELQVTHVGLHKLSLRKNKGLKKPLNDYLKSYMKVNKEKEETTRIRILKQFSQIDDLNATLDAYTDSKGDLYDMANKAIRSNSLDEMRAVRDLFTMLTIPTGVTAMQRAIIQLAKVRFQPNDAKLAAEYEILAKLLVLDPDANISEITALYLQCIDIKNEIYGQKHLNVARTMVNLALALEEFGDLVTAKTFAQSAMKIRTAQLPPEDRLIGECLHVLGSILYRLGEHSEAIILFGKSVTIRVAALGKDHPALASTYTNLAAALEQKDQVNTAEDLLRDALEILRRAYGDDNMHVSDSFLKLGAILFSEGQFEESMEVLEKSIEIRKSLSDAADISLAESYKLLSNILRLLGKYNEAKPMAEQALDIYHSLYGGNHLATTAALYNVGLISDALGKYDDALETFKITLKIRRRLLGNDASEVAEILSSLSSVQQVIGQVDEAEATIQEALEIYRKKHGNEHPMVVECMLNLANIFKMKERLDEAKALYDQTLDNAVKVHGRCSTAVAQLLNNIGVILKQKGELEEAKRMYEEALVIRRQVSGKDHPNVAESLNNLAVLHKEQGRLREAKGFFEQALAIYKKVYNDEHEVVAAIYYNLAGLLYAQDPRSAQALKFGKMAIDIAAKVLGESHPTTKAYREEWP